MMLATVEVFRSWAGAAAASVPTGLVQQCLAEAESALAADVGAPVHVIAAHPDAVVIAVGDVLRRAANLLARRNSPEGVAGVGDLGYIQVPANDPGSFHAVRRIRRHLGIPWVLAV
jgi:hypothetical protein